MPIVSAAFVSVDAKDASGITNRSLSKRLEAVMSKAVADTYNEGITDPVVIKERMMAAYRAERNG